MRLPKGRKLIRIAAPVFGVGLILTLTAIPTYAVVAVPTITAILPGNPAPGCSVTLTGTNFQLPANGGPVTLLTFAGQPGVAPSVIDTDGQLEVTVPAALAVSAATTVIAHNTAGDSLPFVFNTGPAVGCPGVPTATPNTGAVGALITLTGAFVTAPSLVRFNTTLTGPSSTSSSVVTVAVPSGATIGPIHVYTTSGESHTISAFVPTSTTAAPTITGFSPSCGPVATAVTVTGTNLTGATSLRFNGTTAVISSNTGSSIATTVPSGATTGLISVTTPGGTASSSTSFTIPCGAGGTGLARTVSFGLDPNSRVSGQVSVTNGTTACHSLVPVVIQKQKGSAWKWADTTATRKTGSFKTYVPPGHGNFRAKVNQITLANGVVCSKSISNVVHR